MGRPTGLLPALHVDTWTHPCYPARAVALPLDV